MTSYITGDGVFNLALTSSSRTSFTFASRESSYSLPELILETQSGDVFVATSTPSPTATRTLTPSPTLTAPGALPPSTNTSSTEAHLQSRE